MMRVGKTIPTSMLKLREIAVFLCNLILLGKIKLKQNEFN